MKITVYITLKAVRKSKRITLAQLAEMTGISKSYLSELERNVKVPTLTVLCKLAKALEVRPEDLYYYE